MEDAFVRRLSSGIKKNGDTNAQHACKGGLLAGRGAAWKSEARLARSFARSFTTRPIMRIN